MSHKWADRVRAYTTSTGTGDLEIAGTRPLSASLASFLSTGDTFDYTIDAGTEWEVGVATYRTTPERIERTTIYAKYEGGVHTISPGTPLDVSAIADIICSFDANKAGVVTLLADPINDKKAPGDIGVNTQGRGYFLTASIGGHTNIGHYIDVRAGNPSIGLYHTGVAGSQTKIQDGGQYCFFSKEVDTNFSFIAFDPKPLDGSSAASVALFRYTNTTGAKGLYMYRGDGGATLDVKIGVNGEDSYINNGDVGIGNNAPTTKLHVTGNVGEFAARLVNSGSGDGLKIETEDGLTNNGILWAQGADNVLNAYSGVDNACRLRGYHSAVVGFHLDANGHSYFNSGNNLGVKTSAPTSPFHIGGSENITPSGGAGHFQISGNGYSGYTALNATAMYFGHNSASRNLVLRTADLDRITVLGGGSTGFRRYPHSSFSVSIEENMLIASEDDPTIQLLAGGVGESMVLQWSSTLTYPYLQIGTWGSNTQAFIVNPGGGVLAATYGMTAGTTAQRAGDRITSAGNVGPLNNNTYDLGSPTYKWRDLYIQNSPTVGSDERLKENIADLDLLDVSGLIMGLRPVSYTHKPTPAPTPEAPLDPPKRKKVNYIAVERDGALKIEEEVALDGSGNPIMEDDPNAQPSIPPQVDHVNDTKTHFGFIAQEVEILLTTLGITPAQFAPLTYDADADRYGFRYEEMIALMVEHAQAQQRTIDDLVTRVTALETP